MLTGKELGIAISKAIDLKIDSGGARNKAEIAVYFGVKQPSMYDWIKKGSISKDKLPKLWIYFSDVVGPEHWGISEDINEYRRAIEKGKTDQSTDNNKISDRLKQALDNKPGGTQAALAEYCNVAAPSVNGWFSGKTKNLLSDHLRLAAEYLRVNEIWLSTGKGQMYTPREYTGNKQRDALIELIKQAPDEYLPQLERNVHAVYEPETGYNKTKEKEKAANSKD